MDDYTPFANLGEYVSPHDVVPLRRDPWFVWGIAVSPAVPLAALLLLDGVGGVVAAVIGLVVFGATVASCVSLAARDQRAIAHLGSAADVSPRLAAVPVAYLLVRASRRSAEPHRGNPLLPLLLHLFVGFALSYYLVLVLMGVLGVVNRGFI